MPYRVLTYSFISAGFGLWKTIFLSCWGILDFALLKFILCALFLQKVAQQHQARHLVMIGDLHLMLLQMALLVSLGMGQVVAVAATVSLLKMVMQIHARVLLAVAPLTGCRLAHHSLDPVIDHKLGIFETIDSYILVGGGCLFLFLFLFFTVSSFRFRACYTSRIGIHIFVDRCCN